MSLLTDAHSHLFMGDCVTSLCTGRTETWRYVDSISSTSSVVRSYGIHPWDAQSPSLGWYKSLKERVVAGGCGVGECGLHGSYSVSMEDQIAVLTPQWELAVEHNRPLSLHIVHAWEELFLFRKKYSLPARGALIHGFCGSSELASRLVKEGFLLSFGPTLLKSPKSAEALRLIPLNSLLLESDREDDSLDVLENIYSTAATIREMASEELSNAIKINFNRFFF